MMRMDHDESFYTVGEVARSLKITVRMLHHWEAEGLIEPSERSWSNYRLYTQGDVERIQQILIYRGTGMKLAEIKELLADGSSPLEHLRRQREALMEQQARLLGMVRAIDTLLEKEMKKEKLELARSLRFLVMQTLWTIRLKLKNAMAIAMIGGFTRNARGSGMRRSGNPPGSRWRPLMGN